MSRVLRLFALRRKGEPWTADVGFFMDIRTAEQARDEKNGTTTRVYMVCPGPDHKRYTTWLENIQREAARERKEME